MKKSRFFDLLTISYQELQKKYKKFRLNPIGFVEDSQYINGYLSELVKKLLRPASVRLFLSVGGQAKSPACYFLEQEEIANCKRDCSSGLAVSVIVCTFNSEATIERALNSLLRQDYGSIEIIVVDDGSSDRTNEILNNYVMNFGIKAFFNKRNMGVAYSRNIGLKRAIGEYVTFQDSDDISHHSRIRLQLKSLLDSKKVISFCNMHRVSESGDICDINGIVTSKAVISMMFPRHQVLEKIGYFRNIYRAEDSEYAERIITVFGENSVDHLFKVMYFAHFRVNSQTYSDGEVLVNKKFISHVRSNKLKETLKSFRKEHVQILKGERSPFVEFHEI